MVRLVLLVAAAIAVILALDWFVKTPPRDVVRTLRRAALTAAIALVVLLAVTGRLPWLFAALAAAVPVALRAWRLLALAPLLRKLFRGNAPGATGSGPASERASRISTRFLSLSLDHVNGVVAGTVREGRYQGRTLASMAPEELMDLLAICRAEDPRSAAVLKTWLDRTHGAAWHAWNGPGAGSGERPAGGGPITREEALAVLGLQPGATVQQVREAHRRLMQKLHPDRGGSNYLASKINQAKDFLVRGKE